MSGRIVLSIVYNNILDRVLDALNKHKCVLRIYAHVKYVTDLIKNLFNDRKIHNKKCKKHFNIECGNEYVKVYHKNPINRINLYLNIFLTMKGFLNKNLLLEKINKAKTMKRNVASNYDLVPYTYKFDRLYVSITPKLELDANPFYMSSVDGISLIISLKNVYHTYRNSNINIYYNYNDVIYWIILTNASDWNYNYFKDRCTLGRTIIFRTFKVYGEIVVSAYGDLSIE